MKKLIEHLVLIMMAFNIVACTSTPPPIEPGYIEALHPGGTLYYLKEAIRWYPHFGKLILQNIKNNDQFLVMWVIQDRSTWGWTFLDAGKKLADPASWCGNIACPNTARELMAEAFDKGFRPVKEIPPLLIACIEALEKMVRIPAFLIIPAGDNFLPEGILPEPGVIE